jgi:putative hydroxymethylpyrimidine transport system substrate-binding protein
MRTSPRGALSRQLALLALTILSALLAAACGAQHPSSPKTRSVSLVLDFTPNAVHTGIYTAIRRGYDRAAGIDLHVIVPGASTDAIKLLETGRADFAILDIHDLAIAREHGQSIAGILPIVQQPLAAVIAAPKFHDPKQLQGQTVGVSGAPSDLAVLNSVVAGSGGDPAKVKTITIGFNAVADLLAGRVAAATAFWNDEGVTLQRRQPGFHVFRVDAYGAPSYPELVVCASDAFLHAHPDLARALVQTLTRGYGAVIRNPGAGARALESQVQGLDPTLVAAELAKLVPAFTGPEHQFGKLDRPLLHRWAVWEHRFGIVTRTPDVATTFDTRFAPR